MIGACSFLMVKNGGLSSCAGISSSLPLVLVTPTPLDGLQITDKAQKFSEAQVANWEKSWGSSVGRLEMTAVGQAWTKQEKDATTRALTASAPAPQLLFYRPSVKSTEPRLAIQNSQSLS
jgi:hypothetical protein